MYTATLFLNKYMMQKLLFKKNIYDAKENIYSSLTELVCVCEYGSSKYAENKLVRWQLVGY